MLASPLFTYNFGRDAYLLRGIGKRVGPVLREDRRTHREANRRPWSDRSGLLPEGLESSEHATAAAPAWLSAPPGPSRRRTAG